MNVIPGPPRCSRHVDSRAPSPAGFTLLEVTLYITLLLLLGGPLVSAVLVSTRSTKENDLYNSVNERNRTAVFRVEKELRTAIGDSILVGEMGHSVSLTGPAGFDGSKIIPSQPIQFSMRPDRGEKVNGTDDNGNGLVDEGVLVRRNLVTGEEATLAAQIDLSNSSFTPTGTGVTVSISSFGSMFKSGVFTVSKSTTVYPRN